MSEIKRVLERARVVAVVGMSRHPHKAAHSVPAELLAAGFRVIPVNPSADMILGEKAYPRLEDVPEEIDLVNVFRPAPDAPDVARSAAAVGARALWLQQGIVSAEARAIAEAAGIDYIEDRCIAVERTRFDIVKR